MAPLSRLPPGQTLEPKRSPIGRVRFRRVAATLALDVRQLQTLRPGVAEVLISATQAARAGGNGADGVEQWLSNDPRRPATVMALKSLEQQTRLFAGASDAEQIASPESTLRDLEKDPGGYDRLVQAWIVGDLRRLRREAVEPMRRQLPLAYKRMVTDRKAARVDILRKRLAGSGRTVVVVGAGHPVGPHGPPERLRALGYTVDGP